MSIAADAAAPAAVARPCDPRVWLLALGTFAIGTDAFVVSGILPAVAGDLGVGLDAAGQVVTAYALTYALGAPLLAAVTARLPRGRTVTVALACFALANALCALAPTYWLLLGARVLAGVAAALYTPTAYALAAALARPERRGSALAAVAFGLTAIRWPRKAPNGTPSTADAIEPMNGPIVIALNNSTIYFGSALGAALGGVLVAHGLPASGLHWATAALLAAALAAFQLSRLGPAAVKS